MSKTEIAEYLVNLHTLLTAQEQTGSKKSDVILDEYNKNWKLLKDEINKENSNETRNRDHRNVDEDGAHPARDQSSRGSSARHDGDQRSSTPRRG